MRRTAEETTRTRAAILEAALFTFADVGWDRSTLEDIAQRAGLTRGAIYHHFGDKHSLLRAVLTECWAMQSQLLLDPLTDERFPPGQRLVNFVVNYLDKLRSDQSLRALAIVTTLVRTHAPGPNTADLDDHRFAMDVWRQEIRRVIRAATSHSDGAVDQALFGLIALLTGATVVASTDPAYLPDRPAAHTIAAAAIRGWIAED
ncbi:MAG: TetR/AcrR family transcriptional regulator [Pseudonocardiales bacterium]|nr:TetR/AcrR family transcriptional regulator [Pseudonocardiales bacterium]